MSTESQAVKAASSWEGLGPYLRGVREELGKAVWPTRPELIQLTQIVLGIIVSMAIFCGTADYVLGQLASFVFGRR